MTFQWNEHDQPSSIASIKTRLPSGEEFDILRDTCHKGNLGAICSGKMLRITGTFLTSRFVVVDKEDDGEEDDGEEEDDDDEEEEDGEADDGEADDGEEDDGEEDDGEEEDGEEDNGEKDNSVTCYSIISCACGANINIPTRFDMRTGSKASTTAYLDGAEILEVTPLYREGAEGVLFGQFLLVKRHMDAYRRIGVVYCDDRDWIVHDCEELEHREAGLIHLEGRHVRTIDLI